MWFYHYKISAFKKNILCMHNFIASFFFYKVEFNIFAKQFFNKRVNLVCYRKINIDFVEIKLTIKKKIRVFGNCNYYL